MISANEIQRLITFPFRGLRRMYRIAKNKLLTRKAQKLQKDHPQIKIRADIFRVKYLNITGRYTNIHSTPEAVEGNKTIMDSFQEDSDGNCDLRLGGGLIVKLPPIENVAEVVINDFREIFVDKLYEQKGAVLDANDVVLDCGGNIGLFSIYAAQRLGELGGPGKVIVLEPVPDLADIAEYNANELTKLGFETQIQVVRKAVSDRTEEAEILYNNDCFTATSMLEERVAKGVRHPIESQRIDDLVREFDLNRVDFIKMDVEGMEVQALRGAAETIRKWKPRLAISAYHFHDDIYEIPKLIHGICPDYQIEVLRGMGPICYAW